MSIFTSEMKQVFYKSTATNSHLYVWKVQSTASQLLKAVRLSALSCLGKDKMYKVYENGEHKHNELQQCKDDNAN